MNRRDDAGFALLEVMMAMFLITVVMTALTSQFVVNVRAVRQQNDRDVAVSVAVAALSQVRSIRGTALTHGRDAASSHAQWGSPAPGVAAYLSDTNEAWDTTAATGSGATAGLPTGPQSTTVSGVTFKQFWYVGQCWQDSASTGSCDRVSGTGDVSMMRIIVATTWAGQGCPAAGCSYVAATLVSVGSDPVFS